MGDMRWLAHRIMVVVTAASVAGLAPATVFAQDSGVTYDPDSPAGREYALPLEDARSTGREQDATGTDESDGGFGAGIEPAPAASTSTAQPEPRETPAPTPEKPGRDAEPEDEPAAAGGGDGPGPVFSPSGEEVSAGLSGGVLAVGAAALALALGFGARTVRGRAATRS